MNFVPLFVFESFGVTIRAIVKLESAMWRSGFIVWPNLMSLLLAATAAPTSRHHVLPICARQAHGARRVASTKIVACLPLTTTFTNQGTNSYQAMKNATDLKEKGNKLFKSGRLAE